MTATDLETRTCTTDADKDDLTHRFCKAEAMAWLEGEPATARCGKTKDGWIPATGEDMLCNVCYEMYKTESCAHCTALTAGGN